MNLPKLLRSKAAQLIVLVTTIPMIKTPSATFWDLLNCAEELMDLSESFKASRKAVTTGNGRISKIRHLTVIKFL
ncbi:hypothetical protein GZ77_12190 [Endozoicomonas montiporae]|uniref:Uncharacterized protein n=1 Tax=Endozoicomonas montiporae TaxID=1027273 RepID=A0A081N965_9GAMM|nr:hypothetical protein GZ77_07000 [Endozoicomonas montiporae]KEQ14988.1 hypothetical protein GZ77_12190 [Endozoicomonas montiporae]